MIPQHFELVEALPTMTSGKLDRKSLKSLPLTFRASDETQEDPRTETEAVLLDAVREIFPGRAISFDADFFTELGGHSLLAARFVSTVRLTQRLAGITLKDMYAERSLRKLGRALDAHGAAVAAAMPVAPVDNRFEPVPLRRRFWCGFAQAAVTPFILALSTGQWLSVYLSYYYLTPDDASLLTEAAVIVALLAGMQLLNILLVVGVKWLVVGRTRPGRYPLWGSYYFRVWLVQRVSALAHEKWLQGTVFYRVYLRMLGAKVGKDAIIGAVSFEAHDLISIGAGASIGNRTILAASRVEGNELVIGPIEIGDNVSIGGSCVIENDTFIGADAEIGDLTAILSGTMVGALEKWAGSRGRLAGSIAPSTLAHPAEAGLARRVMVNLAYLAGVILIPPLSLIPIIPAFYLVEKLDAFASNYFDLYYLYYIPVLAWPAAMLSIVLTMGLTVVLRWTLLPRVVPGTYSVYSSLYVRKWALGLADDVVTEVLGALYATVYMRTWYRLMGMRIGKDSEISTSFPGRYDLVEVGEKCFIADLANLGEEEISRGWMTLGTVKTGDQVFVGNAAVVPMNTVIPDRVLIGVQSKAPGGNEMAEGSTWFGSPPIRLPVRQRFGADSVRMTFEPTRSMRTRRAIVEALNASFPTMLMICFGSAAIALLNPWIDDLDEHVWPLLVFFLAMSTGISFALMLASAAQKWLLMGVYKPTMQPMWSWWALRTEAVAVTYGTLSSKILFEHLRGTPMLPWLLRLFGVKIGKGVFMDATDITEFDCVEIGDHAVVNAGAVLQTHLYEDRMMKVGRIKIGGGVTVGPAALVLYDTEVGDNARLASLTTVMNGECLPANTNWSGSPAESR